MKIQKVKKYNFKIKIEIMGENNMIFTNYSDYKMIQGNCKFRGSKFIFLKINKIIEQMNKIT